VNNPPEADPHVELYVYTLYRCLFDMPLKQRQEIRDEIRQHVLQIVASNESEGAEHETAVAIALAQFGDPKKIGKHIVDEWRKENGADLRVREIKSRVSLILVTFLCSGIGMWISAFWPDEKRFFGVVATAFIGAIWGLLVPWKQNAFSRYSSAFNVLGLFVFGAIEMAFTVYCYHRPHYNWMEYQFFGIGIGSMCSAQLLVIGVRNTLYLISKGEQVHEHQS
jgi:hypothetical protein